MRIASTYLIRFVFCAAGCALVLLYCYRGQSPGSETLKSYLVTCTLLSLIGIVACLVRIRASRIGGFFSAAAIALVVSFALIALSGAFGPVDGLPWQYFYKDDYVLAFMLIAPITLAVLTGLLTLIPERRTAS